MVKYVETDGSFDNIRVSLIILKLIYLSGNTDTYEPLYIGF